jgi:SNF1-activating kinase 1
VKSPLECLSGHFLVADCLRRFSRSATLISCERGSGSGVLSQPPNNKLTLDNRRTHKALVDVDFTTGRKLINQYEVIEEIGRGMHGKVKLARNLETGENVAIKIIPRFSKKRRLGKVTAMSPQDKTKKEIAILKKIRHPNVVALLEVIDDPELKKIYMVLEHVELGEVVWRKKGLPHICAFERSRVERETRGGSLEEEQLDRLIEHRAAVKQEKRNKISQSQTGSADFWSNEYGAAEEEDPEAKSHIPSRDDLALFDRDSPSIPSSLEASRATSRAPSRSTSVKSMGQALPSKLDNEFLSKFDSSSEIPTPGPLRSNPNSSTALEGTYYGPYPEDPAFRGRSPSMADSIISHMSSIDYNPKTHDPFADDYSYVPCFTFDQARSSFRDTVLGLEYLHYQGVVHRDIKPANLLWTRDHRVKISDFGVSYFGRPIREGEPDDMTSESEAKDFDDDLELSKTVGTPAFFAPELCYTDLDREQPRVSEQIDVWSLGVTLYCLIFARIPFMAEDEFQMFRKIATEDVYIPDQRLAPVDPSTSPNATSLYQRQNRDPYRDDNELKYEKIDPNLHALLRLMLIKNPEKRISLRDIKRHPWVVADLSNPIGWLDDTDPARPSSGRRIQVNEKEMSHAVIPITFLERARSAVKKAVGKVIHPLGERADSKPRRRAPSSAASSAGDSMYNLPPTPHPRDNRRKSLRGDDYFMNASGSDHPLSQSVTASPYGSPSHDPLATAILHHPAIAGDRKSSDDLAGEEYITSEPEVMSSPSPFRPYQRHSHARSVGHGFLAVTPSLPEAQTMPATPFADGSADDPSAALRKARDMQAIDDSSRSRSVDRGLFASTDKRALPKVSLSTAVAPGSVQRPKHPRPMKSIDLGSAKSGSSALSSPLLFSPRAVAGYQHAHPNSDPNIHEKQQRASAELDERPQTAHRIETAHDPTQHAFREYKSSTPDPFGKAKEEQHRRQRQEYEAYVQRHEALAARKGLEPASVPCPPSPEDDIFPAQPPLPSREETMTTAKSSSSTSFGALTTPLTSPSEVTSPISMADFPASKPSSQAMLAFQSDPSLPALLSGASSVSNDLEAELLGQPGIVNTRPSLLETTDSLTPPAMSKEPITGFPLDQALESTSTMDSGIIPLRMDARAAPRSRVSITPESRSADDDDDSDSDGGLEMAKSKKKRSTYDPHSSHRVVFPARRRDTNASIASTETAKKVVVHGDEALSHPDQ